MNRKFLKTTALLIASLVAGHSMLLAAEDDPAPSNPPKAYVGQMPDNDKLKVLVEHKADVNAADGVCHCVLRVVIRVLCVWRLMMSILDKS